LRNTLLLVELLTVFVGVPLLIYKRVLPNLPIPFLLLMALMAFFVLRHDPSFDNNRLWSVRGALQHIAPLLIRDAVLVVILGIAVWFWKPEWVFSFVKRGLFCGQRLWSSIRFFPFTRGKSSSAPIFFSATAHSSETAGC
jgi:hypothetical protein